METTFKKTYSASFSQSTTGVSLWKRFITWTDGQEENRLGWMAVAIAGHGCFFTIFTVGTILLTGNHFIFFPFAIAAIAMTLVTNLAALPTKITIPVFFLSLLIDLVIIGVCLTHGLDINASFR